MKSKWKVNLIKICNAAIFGYYFRLFRIEIKTEVISNQLKYKKFRSQSNVKGFLKYCCTARKRILRDLNRYVFFLEKLSRLQLKRRKKFFYDICIIISRLIDTT